MQRRTKCQGRRYVPDEREVRTAAEAAESEAMYAFTMVAAYSGLRLFEVAGLDAEDFAREGVLTVRRGKGGYHDEASLLYEPGLGALEDVLPESGPVFRTPRGHRWSRQHVSKLWIPMRQEAGLPADCTFHSLRHFHACWLLDRGAQMHDVAAQLRHHDRGEMVQQLYGRQRSIEASLRRLDGLR